MWSPLCVQGPQGLWCWSDAAPCLLEWAAVSGQAGPGCRHWGNLGLTTIVIRHVDNGLHDSNDDDDRDGNDCDDNNDDGFCDYDVQSYDEDDDVIMMFNIMMMMMM